MAKMFYTLDEAAEKLGIDSDAVKELAGDGKLQQFRDRDKLMFKRDEVDGLAEQQDVDLDLDIDVDDALSDTDITANLGDSGLPMSDGSGAIDLMGETPAPGEQSAIDEAQDLSKTGSAIPLADSQSADATGGADGSMIDLADTNGGSGISVFDSGEIDVVDPLAQTQPSGSPDDTDLSLDSISSGSGLLDLTHEHDDTSLGVELDEIMPQDTAAGSMIEATPASSTAASAILEEMASEGAPEIEAGVPVGVAVVEAYDPQGSALTAGLLVGCLIALLLAFMAAVAGVMDAPSSIASLIGASTGSVLAWAGGVLVFSLVLGGIGFVVGKSKA